MGSDTSNGITAVQFFLNICVMTVFLMVPETWMTFKGKQESFVPPLPYFVIYLFLTYSSFYLVPGGF